MAKTPGDQPLVNSRRTPTGRWVVRSLVRAVRSRLATTRQCSGHWGIAASPWQHDYVVCCGAGEAVRTAPVARGGCPLRSSQPMEPLLAPRILQQREMRAEPHATSLLVLHTPPHRACAAKSWMDADLFQKGLLEGLGPPARLL